MVDDQILELFINRLILTVVLLIVLILCAVYVVLAERKVIGWAQLRQGPNVVGPYGSLQTIVDGIKIILKEIIVPEKADKILFLSAPYILFASYFAAWLLLPFSRDVYVTDIDVSALMVLVLSSLSVYSVVFSGWASNSMYAVLGSLRSVAQMISYELSASLLVLTVCMYCESFSLQEIVLAQTDMWHVVSLFPVSVVFFIVMLAETNRVPFDVAEGESEIVGGYSVEYSGLPFAFFFFGEYLGLMFMSGLFTSLFLGGWSGIFIDGVLSFSIKTTFIIFLAMWVRATFPRMRYDQIMDFGWKFLLPLSLLFFIFAIVYVVFF